MVIMEAALALVAAVTASVFFGDLLRSYRSAPRPHTAAYMAGIGLFAMATWALFIGTATGWTSASYRVFFLFGAIINIPVLALGSMFLVVGRRAGHLMLLLMFPFLAISIPMTVAQPFDAGPLLSGGVPRGQDLWLEVFGPRLWAAIGGGMGAIILILLAVVSVFRFWRKNRRIVWGNVSIVAGTVAASTGGTSLALGEAGGFALSLLAAVSLIWLGYRVVPGDRGAEAARAPIKG